MSGCSTILFLCESEKTSLSEFLPISVWLKEQGISVIIALAKENEKIEFQIKQASIPHIVSACKEVSIKFNRIRYLKTIEYVFRQIKNKRVQKKNCLQMLKEKNIGVIVLYHEANFLLMPEIAAAAKKLKIPMVRMQITRTPISFLVSSRLKQGDKYITNTFLKKIYAKLCPCHAQNSIKGEKVIFYTPIQAFILKIAGMLPRYPWHNGDSYADKSLLISNLHLEQEKKEGWRHKNVEVVGQFSLDKLYDNLVGENKSKILTKYFSNNGIEKKCVIVALPQLYEHKIYAKNIAFKKIDALISSFEKTEKTNFLISLHPKMEKNIYESLIKGSNNCKIAEERLSDILHTGDLLLTAFESLVSWSILSGVQPVLLDYYDLEFDASSYPSCKIFSDPNFLVEDLRNALENIDYQQLQDDKRRLDPFDGKSRERIKDIFLKLIEQKHV